MDHEVGPERRCSCKIGRNIDRYGLDRLNETIRRERHDEGTSLRDLADFVNRRILETVLASEGVDLGETAYGAVGSDEALDAIYETLSSDDVAPDRAAHVRTRLAHQGVDIETIEERWVTHPTVRSHLNDCLDIETERTTDITADAARDTIEWGRTRCNRIVSQTVSRLESAGILSIGSPDASISIHISCEDCGETYRPVELLERGSCGCETDMRSTGA